MFKRLSILLIFLVVLGLLGANVTRGETIEVRIAGELDDSEEDINPSKLGEADEDSSDLEMPYEDDGMVDPQFIGIRFQVDIPAGKSIWNAWVRFQVDETKSGTLPVNLIIEGELSPNAAEFGTGGPGTFDISSRPRTAASVRWSVPNWENVGDQGPAQTTVNIAPVIQEIIDQPDWASGNSLVLIISDDPDNPSEGIRCAEAGPGDDSALLHVEFGDVPLDEVWREAEYPDLMGANWRVASDGTASGLKYITDDGLGSNTGSTTPEWVNAYDFEAMGGDYKVLVRVIAPNGSDDSLWVRIPTATAQTAEHPGQAGTGWVRYNSIRGSETWVWDEVHSNDHDNATVIWTLPAGTNVLEIAIREDGTKLDGFVITNNLGLDENTMPDSIDPPPVAGAPIPENGAIEVDTTVLEWIAPDVAVSNTVYLSTDEAIDDTDLLGETELAIQVAVLDPGVTYWWRVDVVEADGTVNTGEVWSFTTLALEAHFPSPADGDRSQPLDSQLSWTGGKDSIMHNVHFGTDPAMLMPVSMMQMATSFDPGALDPETTYYWRVDEFTPVGTIAGPVWSFTTLGDVPITDPDLLLYYDFETGEGSIAIDQSGHSNHGLFKGSPQWATGPFGGAVSIDIATLDYIETAVPLNIVSNTVSVTGWVKHDEVPAAWSGILTHRGTSPGNVGLQHNGNEAGGPELRYMWGADVYWSFSSGLALPIGEWYFAALTVSPDQGKLYLNGVEQTATNVAPHEPTNFDSLVRVGRDHNDGRIMTSLIDEVRFYNRTLTDVEVLALAKPHIADVTAPGDVVKGVPDEARDGDVAGWPDNEHPALAVDDDVSTKFLHFRGEVSPTGFVVEPAVGPTVVTGLTLTTANDSPERDPASFELSGSNESIDGPYELIAAGDIADFAQATEWPRFTMNATPIVFDNDVAYKYYQVMFPTVRNPGVANSMQITEVELLGVPAPVAHWTFDDGAGTVALDSSGNASDGALVGDPQWVPGILGGALEFDGDGDYVDCGNPAVLDITGDITVMCWIKVAAFSKTWETILAKGDDSYRMSRGPGDGDSIHFGANGTGDNLNANTIVTTDTWRHVALVYNGTDKIIYIDGVEDARLASSGNINHSGYSLFIGENSQAVNRHLTGSVDDVRIYNQALSALQIRDIAGL